MHRSPDGQLSCGFTEGSAEGASPELTAGGGQDSGPPGPLDSGPPFRAGCRPQASRCSLAGDLHGAAPDMAAGFLHDE